MGGHGGLNILPQKRWNVYNFDNREKVKKDEEAAAKEEQLKREQSRKRVAEIRLEKLRQARGVSGHSSQAAAESVGVKLVSEPEPESEPKSNHINLFEGIRIFDPVTGAEAEGDDKRGGFKKMKMAIKKEAEPRVVTPEDEKYRLGYGIAGKGVKLPWYLSKPGDDVNQDTSRDDNGNKDGTSRVKSSGKKTIQELREERLKREKREKERERALLTEKSRSEGAALNDKRLSRRGLGWQ